ncbi:MAG: ABC transporter permease [Bacteroidetes bacterium]|nr:ABC transporter permease [Bacteroidota bacterium]
MLRDIIKTAIRNILTHRSHTIINIAGLTIGISILFMIMIFVRHQLSYDKKLTNYSRIYKLSNNHIAPQSAPLAPLLQRSIPEIEDSFRFFMMFMSNPLISYNEKNILIDNCAYADSTFTSMFSFPFVAGDHIHPLSELNSIILTESVAKKIFGNENPIGKIVTLDNSRKLKVTAILEDLPDNSTFNFSALISLLTFESYGVDMGKWGNNWYDTYILVSQGINREALQKKINDFIKEYFSADDANELKNGQIFLHNLHEVYFDNQLQFDKSKHGNYYFVLIFLIIGMVVLLIAIINFVNLSTAKSSIRTKEIGLRKVFGSSRINIVWLFLTESVMLSIVSTILAVTIVELLNPYLTALTGIYMKIGYGENPGLLLFILLFSIILGVIIGFFPALLLSSVKISYLLKNFTVGGRGGKISRAILIVSQFVISMVLIISTIVIVRQLNYLKDKKLGFNQDNLLFMELHGNIGGSLDAFKQELKNNPNIIQVAFSHRLPGKQLDFLKREMDGKDIEFYSLYADPDYIDLMGLEIVEGRNFSREYQADVNYTVILNETAVKQYEIENPVGKSIRLFDDERKAKIIGIIKDFHFKSLYHAIEPLALVYKPDVVSYANIKISKENTAGAIEHIETTWNKFYAGYPFSYTFMDTFQQSLYNTEDKLMKMLVYFTFFAIFIACLGLFGLVSYITERRSKEIGIRKVYGASIASVVFYITKDISKWIVVAFIIACPIGYWFAHQWLVKFAFQTTIPWWIYAATGVLGLSIGLLTLSFETYKAAVKNPLESIKHE